MALQVIITKKSVKTAMPKLFSIDFNMRLLDDSVEVINQDFSCTYKPGDGPSSRIAEVKEKMQEAVDNYKNERQIFISAALDSAVTALNGGIVL